MNTLIASLVVWTLTMQGAKGPETFGPYATLDDCKRAANLYFVVQNQSHWHDAACSSTQSFRVKNPKEDN